MPFTPSALETAALAATHQHRLNRETARLNAAIDAATHLPTSPGETADPETPGGDSGPATFPTWILAPAMLTILLIAVTLYAAGART